TILRRPRPTLFPYTSLFRSTAGPVTGEIPTADSMKLNLDFEYNTLTNWKSTGTAFDGQPSSDLSTDIYNQEQIQKVNPNGEYFRSEEHTSELQSRENLVCRL